jgi:hypothetical protein
MIFIFHGWLSTWGGTSGSWKNFFFETLLYLTSFDAEFNVDSEYQITILKKVNFDIKKSDLLLDDEGGYFQLLAS